MSAVFLSNRLLQDNYRPKHKRSTLYENSRKPIKARAKWSDISHKLFLDTLFSIIIIFVWYSDSNFTISYLSQWSFDNKCRQWLPRRGRHVLTKYNDDQVHWQIYASRGINILTHCGLVTPCGVIKFGENWARKRVVAWRHQAFTWTNVIQPSYGFHTRAIPQEMLKICILGTSLKLIISRLRLDLSCNGQRVKYGLSDIEISPSVWCWNHIHIYGSRRSIYLWRQ